MTTLFDRESLEMLRNDLTVVLYSNGGTHAAQAWVLPRQLGIESYVLLGGLNYWVEGILNPEPPSDLVADSEIEKYQLREATSEYFDREAKGQTLESKPEPVPKPVIKFKRKKAGDGGC
jgi:3-mercaptopyruvate sulfurtransferase SseA